MPLNLFLWSETKRPREERPTLHPRCVTVDQAEVSDFWITSYTVYFGIFESKTVAY